MEKELEVKILDVDFDSLQARIIELGGNLIAQEEQINIIIDSSQNPIGEKIKGYMRIRITKDLLNGSKTNILTLKEKTSRDGIRENKEYNLAIGEVKTALEIFDKLGYDEIKIGYKDRKSYSLASSRIDFDVWDKKTYPYPYVEIEVSKEEDLKNLLKELRIDREKVSLKSIKELRQELGMG